jgi:transposase
MAEKESRRRRQFPEEVKCGAVELVRSTGRPIAQIAQELGIDDSTLGNWVRQDRIDRGEQDGLTATSAPGWVGWRPRTPGWGWSVIC